MKELEQRNDPESKVMISELSSIVPQAKDSRKACPYCGRKFNEGKLKSC